LVLIGIGVDTEWLEGVEDLKLDAIFDLNSQMGIELGLELEQS
jgi:hypothetical protein